MSQNDFRELVNHCLHLAEHFLIEQNGEFYPFGARVYNNGQLTNVGHFDGDDFPLSETVLIGLKKHFENEISTEKIRAYAITFDCLAKKDSDSEKIDSVAIECYSGQTNQRIVYYYPYKLTDTKIDFGEPWAIDKS